MKKTGIWLLTLVLAFCAMGCGQTVGKQDAASYLDEVVQKAENGYQWGDKVDFGLPYCYKYKEWSEESTEDGWKGEENISSENAYSFRIDRLRADGKVLLTDTTFDMKEYLTEADSATAYVRGVFYDGENGNIYIPVSSVDKEYTWLVEVPTEKAEDYTVTEFAGESNWFGHCYRLGDFIYLNGGASAIPIAINPATRELRTCALEYEGATEIAQKWIKENQPSWENAQVFWFWAMDEAPDGSIIYYAMVQEDMDTDTLLEIYLAYRGTEQVAYKVKEGV